jgi:hypothetical protein
MGMPGVVRDQESKNCKPRQAQEDHLNAELADPFIAPRRQLKGIARQQTIGR